MVVLEEGKGGGREGLMGSCGNGGGAGETGVTGTDSLSRNWTNKDDKVGCTWNGRCVSTRKHKEMLDYST